MDQKVVYRSGIAYMHLALVVIVSVLVALGLGRTAGGIVAVVGLLWVLLTWRSGIEVTDDGFNVRGLVRTRRLGWSETDAFIVVGYSGETAYFGSRGISPEEATTVALAHREHMFSLVAVVTSHGRRIKVPGTASTFLDTTFPAHAATELNRTLKSYNPVATAS